MRTARRSSKRTNGQTLSWVSQGSSTFVTTQTSVLLQLFTNMDNPEVEQQPPNLNTLLLRKLSAAVNGHAATATFACGGSVPIIDESAGLVVDPGKLAVCSPVKIRCDTSLVHNRAYMIFPYHDSKARFDEELQALLRKCGRATFGIGGRDVLDEGYRKASKLDASQFSSNFHPHDCGILDSIQQVLLPSTVRGGLELGGGPQSIKAELYKLNVSTLVWLRFWGQSVTS